MDGGRSQRAAVGSVFLKNAGFNVTLWQEYIPVNRIAVLCAAIALLSAGGRLEAGDEPGVDSRAARRAYEHGLAALSTGDVDCAISAFTDAIRLNPRFEEAYYDRGSTVRAHRPPRSGDGRY